MSKNKKSLRDKKNELEAELKGIEYELDGAFHKVKTDISSKLDPREYVRRHPLSVVGIAALIGFFAGKEGGRSSSSSSKSKSDEDKLTSTVWYEMKRLATKKALSLAGDYLEGLFDDN